MDQEKNNAEPQNDEVIKSEKKKSDHRIGVGLFFGVNILLLLLTFILGSTSLEWCGVFLPYVVNIGLIVYLSKTNRSDIALGYLGGFFYAFLIVLVLGVFYAAACFIGIVPY